MKVIKTANGKTIFKISKSEWLKIGAEQGWTGALEETLGGLGGGIAAGGDRKAQEYAQRIVNGEPREKVLQQVGPETVKKVDMYLQQMSPQSGQQYSVSQADQWAMSTGNPTIIEYVDKVNNGVQTQGSNYWAKSLTLIMNSMKGDKTAFNKLLRLTGGKGQVTLD